MRLKSTHLVDIAESKDLFIDFESLGPGLIAFVGPCGSGKTTALESSAPASLYRVWPSSYHGQYGEPLTSRFISKDSSIENIFTLSDKEYRILHTFDESFFYCEKEALASKRTAFDEVISQIFPSIDEFMIGPFAAQMDQYSLLKLKKAARKKVFAEMIGAQEYEKLAQLASQEATKLFAERNYINDNILEVQGLLENQKELKEKIKTSGLLLQKKSEQIDGLIKKLQLLRASQALITEDIIKDRERLKLAEKELERITEQKTKLWEEGKKLKTELDNLKKLIHEDASLSGLKRDEQNLTKQLESIKLGIEDREKAIEYYRKLLTPEQASYSTIKSEIDSQETMGFAYISIQGSYEQIDLEHPMCRVCPLTDDGRAAASEIKRINEFLETANKELAGIQLRLIDLHLKIEEADNQKKELTAQAEKIRILLEVAVVAIQAKEKLESTQKDLLEKKAQYEEVGRIHQKLAEEIKALSKIPEDKSSKIAQLEELLSNENSAYESLKKSHWELEGHLKSLEQRLETNSLKSLQEKANIIQRDMDDYENSRSALLFTRDDEIAQACPEVSELSNILLSEYDHGRWAVELKPSDEKKDGSEKDGFAITIFDTRYNSARKNVSGGQRIIIDEAIRLATGIWRTNLNRLQIETLWRDETTGSLDNCSAEMYIRFLRKAMEMAPHLHQIIFIAHHESVFNQADRRIFFKEGNIERIE